MLSKIVRKISSFIAVVLFHFKYKISVIGRESFPDNGGVLLCANHRTAEDPILLYLALRKRYIHYFAKQALTENCKLAKWYLEDCLGTHCITHTASDTKAIKWGVAKLKEGEVVGIFPEGTRNRTQQPLLELQKGAAFVAHCARAQVVTATINCTYKWFTKCEIVFSEPLDFGDAYENTLNRDRKNEIMKKIEENLLKNVKK